MLVHRHDHSSVHPTWELLKWFALLVLACALLVALSSVAGGMGGWTPGV